jgi:large subunit ribosomal protein L12
MEYVYGALLLNAAGKTIDEKGLTGVLTAAGVTADAARVAETFAAPSAAAAPADKKEGKAEKKEEEKKEEKGVSEEEAAEGLSALFG